MMCQGDIKHIHMGICTGLYIYCYIYEKIPIFLPVPVAARFKAFRLLRSLVRIPPGVLMFVVSVVCCQVEVSATS